jgi:ABC-type uncharacterized transport system permease subunit
VSQVAFAIVGAVMPLTYGSWSGYLGENSNTFAIGLFGAGLATTFSYIFSEVWAAALNDRDSPTRTNYLSDMEAVSYFRRENAYLIITIALIAISYFAITHTMIQLAN